MTMRELLERAGFRVRGPKRADCAHCTGRSRGTVSYTAEVAYCHRCHWTGNVLTLAHRLGLGSPVATADQRANEEREALLAAFDAWREARVQEVLARSRALSRCARHAHSILRRDPEREDAWDALARLYHEEPILSATLDFLMCVKASVWLEPDATIEDVFAFWRASTAASKKTARGKS